MKRKDRRQSGGRLLAAAALICLTSSLATAGAWTQPKGAVYYRFGGAYLDSDERFDADGNRVSTDVSSETAPGEYESREARFYGEYGVFDDLTAYGYFALKRIRAIEPATVFETWGGGDIMLGGRYRLYHGPTPVSVAGEIRFPSGYDTSEQPALGNGETDLTVRMLAGASAMGGYLTADLGFNVRGGPYRNEWLGSFEVGRDITSRLYGRTLVRFSMATGNDDGLESPLAFDPALVSPSTVNWDGAAGFRLAPGLSVEAGLSHVVHGESALAGTTYELAFSGALPRIR